MLRAALKTMLNDAGEALIKAGKNLDSSATSATISKPFGYTTYGIQSQSINNSVRISRDATVLGNARINSNAFVYPNATIRGDVVVGYGTVIGRNSILVAPSYAEAKDSVDSATGSLIAAATTGEKSQVSPASATKLVIGSSCSIGEGSVLQSCIIDDNVTIGKNCVVSEGAIIEREAVLDDNSVIMPGVRVPSKQRWSGNPANFVEEIHDH